MCGRLAVVVVVVVVRVSESGELHQPSTIIDHQPAEEFWLAGAALVRLWSAHSYAGGPSAGECLRLWAAGVGTGSAALDRGIFYLHRVLSVAPLPSLQTFLQAARLHSSGQAHSNQDN